MTSLNPPRLLQFEYATLTRDSLHGKDAGIVKRAGTGLAGGEFGNFDRLLSMMGESGWECVGITTDPNGSQSLLFKRPIR